jgi:hypothetical protein
MKNWLAFLFAVVIFITMHEGIHALMATLYGEYEALIIKAIGFPEVQYTTPVEERSGVHWIFISGTSNLATILVGYLLLLIGDKLARLRGLYRSTLFYLTLILLLADPLNLSIGPFIYGGDADGIALGLGINRSVIQFVFLVVLFVNRELIAQKLLPMYGVQTKNILFRPLIPWTKENHEVAH